MRRLQQRAAVAALAVLGVFLVGPPAYAPSPPVAAVREPGPATHGPRVPLRDEAAPGQPPASAEAPPPVMTPAPAAGGAPVSAAFAAVPGREGEPVGLELPALGIAGPVHPMGVDDAGRLEMPDDIADIGWWADGALLPGTATVLVGHVDSRSGPGVFARLNQARVGQEVTVTDGGGTMRTYRVTAVRRVPKHAFPTEYVYGPRDEPTLQLVTCSGRFDRSSGHYRDNLIVTAVLAALPLVQGDPVLPQATRPPLA